MAAPSITNTFTSNTTALASEINANFADILAGLSSGSTWNVVVSTLTSGTTTLGATSATSLKPATAAAFTFYLNNGTTEIGSYSTAGVWILGATSTTGNHNIQSINAGTSGALDIKNLSTADAWPACRMNTAATTDSTANKIVNFVRSGGSTAAGAIVCNGSGGAAFGAFSDERLKENFSPLEEQLSKIMAIEVMRFDFKGETGSKNCIGTTAQKLKEIYPDCVSEEDDDMKTMSIGGWGPTEYRLVKAIQELKAIVDAQAAKIEALEAK